MASKKKAAKAVALNAADVANIAKSNPYIQRLIDDAGLRENVQKAIESGKSAYGRLSNGKAPHKAIIEDKKLQKDLRQVVEAVREASVALTDAPKKRRRKGLGLGRKLLIVTIGGGLALAGSESLRSKVLDTLFGKEEEFEYTPPAGSAATPPATPVSAA
ncbi:MAG: hypothetical protein ACR2JH_00130 [Solirubrobacteraceae bacterium]